MGKTIFSSPRAENYSLPGGRDCSIAFPILLSFLPERSCRQAVANNTK